MASISLNPDRIAGDAAYGPYFAAARVTECSPRRGKMHSVPSALSDVSAESLLFLHLESKFNTGLAEIDRHRRLSVDPCKINQTLGPL